MKKLAFLFFFLLGVTIHSHAQDFAVKKFVKKYKKTTGLDNVKIEKDILKLNKEIKAHPKGDHKISNYQVINFPENNPVKNQDVNTLLGDLQKDNYDSIVQININGKGVNLLVKTDDDENITNFFFLSQQEEKFTMMYMEGSLKLSDFKHMDIDINID